ncbi:hypothetical protein [Photobacterium swingsii]|uniref:hypothetical protein n=1 Tax=Photobacterium swingsii TaxID=680026 RepID=UPI004067A289
MFKKSIILSSVIIALSGCNDSEDYIYQPQQERYVDMSTTVAPVMEVKSNLVGVNSINEYQHDWKLDDYVVEINELQDGGENGHRTGLSLVDGNFTFPVIGEAIITAYHKDDVESPDKLNGNVSQIYTYHAKTEISNSQVEFQLKFVNHGWMYITAVYRDEDIANIESVSLVEDVEGRKVEMVRVDDANGNHYFYGYVRANAKLEITELTGKTTSTDIPYITETGNNEGNHGEFVVSKKDGNVIIEEPDWTKLPIITPIAPPEVLKFTEYDVYTDVESCKQGAMKYGVSHYIPVPSSCLFRQDDGQYTEDFIGDKARITPSPLNFSDRYLSGSDYEHECNSKALASGLTHYSWDELNSECYVSTEDNVKGEFVEYDLYFDKGLTAKVVTDY